MILSDAATPAAYALNDADMVRWEPTTWVAWGTECLRAIAAGNPDLFRTQATVSLVPGVEQTMPEPFTRITRVAYTRGDRPRELRFVDRASLVRFLPTWRTARASRVPKNYTYDPLTRERFEVYPPQPDPTDSELTVEYNAPPPVLSSLSSEIPLPDTLAPAVTDYLLYRALINDAEEIDARERATIHLQRFEQSVVARATTDASVIGGMT